MSSNKTAGSTNTVVQESNPQQLAQQASRNQMTKHTGTLIVSLKNSPAVLVNLLSERISIGRIDGLQDPIHVTSGRIGLKDSTLDPNHAVVLRDDEGQFWIENSSDTEINVTEPRVRLKARDKRVLKHETKFEIGDFQFIFRSKTSLDSAEPEEPIQITARSTEGVATSVNADQEQSSQPAPPVDHPAPATAPAPPSNSEAQTVGENDSGVSSKSDSSKTDADQSAKNNKPAAPSAPASQPTQAKQDQSKPAKPAPEPQIPRLPNGIVGTAYDHPIPMDQFVRGKKSIRPEFSSDIGLRVESGAEGLHVVGTPTVDGKHVLTIEYDAPNLPGRKVAFEIFVNPDPRSLWKNLDSDPSLPYQKDVSDSALQDVNGARLVAASVRGRSHAHEGTFRDDDFTLGSKKDWHFIAVSDGAGSAKYSRKGSSIACDTAYQEFFDRIDELDEVLSRQPAAGIQNADKPAIGKFLYNIFGNAGKKVFANISQEAANPSEDGVDSAVVNDFAATLIYTAFKKFEFGWFVAAFAIGDGGVAVYHKTGDVHVMNNPDGGEYAGQTRFATMSYIWDSDEEIRKRIQVHVVPEFTAIVAMTDGVSDPKFGTDKNFFDTQQWHAFWDDIGGEVDFKSSDCHKSLLTWLDFWSAGNHDDRTIAIGLIGHE